MEWREEKIERQERQEVARATLHQEERARAHAQPQEEEAQRLK